MRSRGVEKKRAQQLQHSRGSQVQHVGGSFVEPVKWILFLYIMALDGSAFRYLYARSFMKMRESVKFAKKFSYD